MTLDYPEWFFYPSRKAPPEWVAPFINAVAAARPSIDSSVVSGITSDAALAKLRPGLEALGFQVEAAKEKAHKIFRPVLFGDQGSPLVTYEIDAWNEEHKIVVEVEAGRAMKGNAVYRDLIRTPLIFDAAFAHSTRGL